MMMRGKQEGDRVSCLMDSTHRKKLRTPLTLPPCTILDWGAAGKSGTEMIRKKQQKWGTEKKPLLEDCPEEPE